MRWRNTTQDYGWLSILLHWGMAVLIIGLFGLGKYMMTLDYYHPLYLQLPELHRGVGVLVAGLLVLRLVWRLANPLPQIPGDPWERPLALLVHRLFYALLFAIVVSGYLISTADGHPVSVFGWFEVPATVTGKNLEDRAGDVHYFLTWLLAFMLLLHVSGALKHHFFDRDFTLTRMLGFAPAQRNRP